MADQQVDARGLNCPMPIVKTAQAVQAMASGSSGTYSAQVAVWVDMEVRALFRKPSNEGLRSSVSGSVQVQASPGCTDLLCPLDTGR